MTNANEDQVVDYDDMSDEDKVRTMELLSELNKIFDKYIPPKDTDEEVSPE